MREEFEKLVTAGKLGIDQVDGLEALVQGGYCMHRSWGFGKITTVDTVFSRLTIDFIEKPGHSMDLGFAVKSLQPIGKDHIYARKYSDLEGVKQLAAINHLDLIKVVLQSFDNKATVAQIQGVLVPEVIEDDWKKWWEVARKEMKKDGHFTIPLKKAEPIEYHDEEVSLQDRLLEDFSAAKGLKARVAVTQETVKSLDDLEDAKATADQMVVTLSAEIQSHLATQSGVALEAIFVRDDLLEACEAELPEGVPVEGDVWKVEGITLSKVLENLPAAKHRRALASYRTAFPDIWHEGVLGIINEVGAKLAGECANILGGNGQLDLLKETLGRLISQHQASTELILWLCKSRSDTFADILGPEVFRAAMTAIERDQFNEKRSNRLSDYFMDDKELVTDLLESADIEVIKDIVRALKMSGSFDDMDTRSLLARIVKQYPAIQSLISGGRQTRDQGLIVSWTSLERRKDEYEELVRKKIPANSKEIAIARSYGDLRENHEYKSAKEMQKLLMNRKAELENDLTRARGTDFKEVSTEHVNPGTKVTLTDLGSGSTEIYSVLGAWDSDPDAGIISYETPMAKALLTHKVGEEIDFGAEDNQRRLRIDAIAQVEGDYSQSVVEMSADEEEEAEVVSEASGEA